MDYRVVWTRGAIANLTDIAEYVKRDSPYYASVVVFKIRTAARSLKKYPYRAHRMRELDDNQLREIVIYDYRLIYEIFEGEQPRIEILMIVHSARMLQSDEFLRNN